MTDGLGLYRGHFYFKNKIIILKNMYLTKSAYNIMIIPESKLI